MSSLMGEEMLLDNGYRSELISPPLYKRRKISALRDFPDGCGPISRQNSMQKKDVVVCRENEGDVQKLVDSKGNDLRQAKDFFLEKSKKSEGLEIPVCSNEAELVASNSVKRGKAEDGIEELLDLPLVNPIVPVDAINYEMVGEGTSLQPCKLPCPPTPINPVSKERRSPSRRRVSAVRDFPDGCGPSVPKIDETQDKHLSETKRNICKEVVVTDVNQIEEEPEDNNASKDKIQEGAIFGKGGKVGPGMAKQLNPQGLGFEVSLPPNVGSPSEKGARRKVRDTLRLFHGVLRKLLQAEEKKSGQANASIGIHLNTAAKILRDRGKYINTTKMTGPIPGVEVGDFFNYRVELSVIGLHGPTLSGIDCVKQDNELIATSVVASGRYDNDLDNSDVLIYIGQGGNLVAGGRQPQDQKLEKGNLALKNSIDKKNLVRVIKGFKETKRAEIPGGKPKTIATYTYDGLYTVERYWHDLGPHGKLIYKFELRRVPHQPELTWKKVTQSKKSKARAGCCVDDISKGKDIPLCAVNTIDDEKPPPFMYITAMIYPDWCQPIPPLGCGCKDGCSDSKNCTCAVKNGGEIPYNHNGAIVEAKSLVYECGPSCKCPPSCPNRVSQHGIKLPLEIFKTESRGWGVRCLSFIPSGSFVCEYLGEILDDKEAEQRIGNDEYLFDIGQNYNDFTSHDELSALVPDMPSSCSDVVEKVGFTIDAAKHGNIGRFVNHSCSPNLYAQNVLYDHDDKRIPHIMLFASENIPPLQELSYHYNYTIDQVFDSEGNVKKKSCHCGSPECTGWMY